MKMSKAGRIAKSNGYGMAGNVKIRRIIMKDTTERTLKIQVPNEWSNEWPCSRLAGKEINVVLDGRDLVDFSVTDGPLISDIHYRIVGGRKLNHEDLESAELTAVIERHLEEKAKKKFIDEKVMFVAV